MSYTAEGNSWEGNEDAVVFLLPGQHTDVLTSVRDAVNPTPLDEQDAAPHTKYRVFLGE